MLKQLDGQICLDDFGTGYSSFSYLHQFPIDIVKDIVKIERSFIQDIGTDAEKLAISACARSAAYLATAALR